MRKLRENGRSDLSKRLVWGVLGSGGGYWGVVGKFFCYMVNRSKI